MTEALLLLAGLAAGLAVGWLRAQAGARGELERSRAETAEARRLEAAAVARAEELMESISRQKATAEELRQQLRESFQLIAGESLKASRAELVEQAELQLKPFREQIEKLAEQTRELEQSRHKALGALYQEITKLGTATQQLQSKSEALALALRGDSRSRGVWGENVLQRVLELSGMKEGVHFTKQEGTEDRLRPDFLVMLPGGEAIPLDSKVPMAAWLDAQQLSSEADRRPLLEKHARDVRDHVRKLGRKDYAASVSGRVQYTVMFLPGDHLLDAAFQINPRIQEEAMQEGVLITTPVTLLALLRTVALYWQQQGLSENAARIAETARTYHERMRTFTEHLSRAGGGLRTAVDAYNKAVGSYNRQVLPQGRRLEELQSVDPQRTLREPEPVDTAVREDLA